MFSRFACTYYTAETALSLDITWPFFCSVDIILQIHRDFYADGYFFGIDVENANYITSTTSPAKIGAFNPFPDNMKAEALVATAMYDLWDGKNEAHDIVELDKFYLMFLVEYANNTFTLNYSPL